MSASEEFTSDTDKASVSSSGGLTGRLETTTGRDTRLVELAISAGALPSSVLVVRDVKLPYAKTFSFWLPDMPAVEVWTRHQSSLFSSKLIRPLPAAAGMIR